MATLTPRAHAARPGGAGNWIAHHPLLAFFGLAFGISWFFMFIDGLGYYGLIPYRLTLSGPGLILVLLMGYGPTLAALIVTWATEGRSGIRTLLTRLLPWRAGLPWYVLALALPALLVCTSVTLEELLGATRQPLPGPALQVALMGVVSSIVMAIVNGEEIGWRGYALPHLQERYTALTASLILVVPWFAFHVPIMFIPGSIAGGQTLATALPFLVGIVPMSIVITWIFNSTRGSLLPLMLLHGAYNTWPGLLATTGGNPARLWVLPALTAVLAVIVVLVYGPTHLARKPAPTAARVLDNH